MYPLAAMLLPLLASFYFLQLWRLDLSVPLVYWMADEIWQYVLTKALKDNGWILQNVFLGAPGTANWSYHMAAQTSALHSVLMLGLMRFIDDAVRVQQVYYLINFSLIGLSGYLASRAFGVARILAVLVGLLFAFVNIRINLLFYAFLANYFMIPLSVIPVMWLMLGRFDRAPAAQGTKRIWPALLSRRFLTAVLIIALTAVSDGYYAFFTLLLLGYAIAVNMIGGTGSRLVTIVTGVVLCATILVAATTLMAPLQRYQDANHEEFYPNGVIDPSLVKRPFEAEVYSPSLKLLVAPNPNHRIPALGRLGKTLIDSSDDARKYRIGTPAVSLGLLASLLLFGSLLWLLVPRRRMPVSMAPETVLVIGAFASAAAFVLLTCTSGGLGTLVAMLYPAIRAYDRFPLYLIIILLIGGAYAATRLRRHLSPRWRAVFTAAIVVIALLGLFDEVPGDSLKYSPETRARFLAEREVVGQIEQQAGPGAMIYQYPFSQYLTDNRYYGWGSFAQLRLYLHSHALRWSNGASKNSAVDLWHMRLAERPLSAIVEEARRVGFAGFVVDRLVIKDPEYAILRHDLVAMLGEPEIENDTARLAYWRLPSPGYRIIMDERFRRADALVVLDKNLSNWVAPPASIDMPALAATLQGHTAALPLTLTRSAHPAVFTDEAVLTRGNGWANVTPSADLKGSVSCAVAPVAMADIPATSVTLTVTNASSFIWFIGAGPAPITVGAHLLDGSGNIVPTGQSFRLGVSAELRPGSSAQFTVPLAALDLAAVQSRGEEMTVAFRLLQEGNVWFGDDAAGTCRLAVRP
ncbi:hypothetical protein D9599_11565 [Roseomonas sp. KE2513]|nr:hypothetical protein [Roseomonas sp. KE2513]